MSVTNFVYSGIASLTIGITGNLTIVLTLMKSYDCQRTDTSRSFSCYNFVLEDPNIISDNWKKFIFRCFNPAIYITVLLVYFYQVLFFKI